MKDKKRLYLKFFRMCPLFFPSELFENVNLSIKWNKIINVKNEKVES